MNPVSKLKPKPLKKEQFLSPDFFFYWSLKGFSLSFIFLLFSIAFYLYQQAMPAMIHLNWEFFSQFTWNPSKSIFGIPPLVYGTFVSSFLALFISMPISIGVAILVTQLLPPLLSHFIGFLIEMLAAIPSIVYGLWGIFVLVPWLEHTGQPWLAKYLGFLPFFQGYSYGVGMLAAILILALMITPTLFSLTREIFISIPHSSKEAILALGATRWEMIQISILHATKRGIFSAALLALGRALGETMAISMVIGNYPQISLSLFAPAQSMANIIANEYMEASSELHLAALGETALLLFGLTFLIHLLARTLIFKYKS